MPSIKQIEFLLSFKVKDPNAPKRLSSGLTKVSTEAKKTGNAIKGLTAVQGRANYALLNTTRLVSDMPFLFTDWRLGIMAISNNIDPLVASVQAVNYETKGFKGTIKALLRQLKGAPGIGLAISVITGAFLVWSQNSRKAKVETTELLNVTKELLKLKTESITSPFDISKVNASNIDTFIQRTTKLIHDMKNQVGLNVSKNAFDAAQFNKFVPFSYQYINAVATTTDKNQDLEESLQNILDVLTKYKAKLEATKLVMQSLTRVGIAHRKSMLTFLDNISPKGYENIGELGALHMPLQVDFVPTIDYDALNYVTEDMRKEFQAVANAMMSIFNQAWEGIFGKANSLLEIFLQNLAQGLLQIEAQKLASNIITNVFGGSILGSILGLFTGNPTTGDNSGGRSTEGNVIAVYLDGKELTNATAQYLPSVIHGLQRQRRL